MDGWNSKKKKRLLTIQEKFKTYNLKPQSMNENSYVESESSEDDNTIRIDNRFIELAKDYEIGSQEYENNLLSSVLYSLRNYLERHSDDK